MVSTALLQSKEVLQNETSSLTQASEDCSSDDLKSPRIALSLQNTHITNAINMLECYGVTVIRKLCPVFSKNNKSLLH